MMPHRFAEQRACGLAVAGIEHERAEIVQRGKIVRLAAQQFQIVALGVLETALFAQKTGAFGARREIIRVARERPVELA